MILNLNFKSEILELKIWLRLPDLAHEPASLSAPRHLSSTLVKVDEHGALTSVPFGFRYGSTVSGCWAEDGSLVAGIQLWKLKVNYLISKFRYRLPTLAHTPVSLLPPLALSATSV